MSHGILENDKMFSVKERPWHGLGTVVETAPSVKEAIKLAGLDWKVELQPICTNTDNKLEITTHKAVVKENTKDVLGIVGSQYTPLQNEEAFEWFQPFVENDLASLETAGSLFNGKKVWILAKTKNVDDVVEGDTIENFILLSNSHDGSSTLKIGFTPIRVVCNNTLSYAEGYNLSKLINIRHTQSIVENMQLVRDIMDTVNNQFIATIEQYKKLTQRDINQEDLKKYVKQVFSSVKLENIIKDYEAREQAEIESERKRLMARVEEFFEMEPARKTWNMYNAVNSYLNHERCKTLENRYDSMWFGDSKKIDRKAFELALKMY